MTKQAVNAAAEIIVDALLDAGHNGLECDVRTPLAKPILEAHATRASRCTCCCACR